MREKPNWLSRVGSGEGDVVQPNIEYLIRQERAKASLLSNRMAEFVLTNGDEKKLNSVWYRWERHFPEGGRLLLQVADVNKHGRDLKAILGGGNPNDRLETYLTLPFISEGFAASSVWSLSGKKLSWLRAYPSHESLINWRAREWYTYFPSLLPGQPESEILRAHQIYTRYLETIAIAIGSDPSFQLEAGLFQALSGS